MKTLRILAASVALALALPAMAQERPATLVADRLSITGDNVLVAEGAVEVLYQGQRMRAQRITFDRAADLLTIEGPITLVDPASGAIVTADAAELTTDLREGILTGARMVLEQQLQLAANTITRSEGRYTELSRTVASSCQVCAANPTPLWEIRAARVLHDEVERQLYFDRAQFRVMGVPVAYIPRLRMPDPTLDRADGFLTPRFRTTSTLGYGVKLPYFITLGDHADLTLSPYVATRSRTLEFRYRQALANGSYTFEGGVSKDKVEPDEMRGYLFGSGQFNLPRDFVLTFGLQTVSDSYYLQDYDITDQDRLTSHVTIARTRRDEHISARLFNFHSIRAGEVNSLQPTIVGDATWLRRGDLWGGIGSLSLGTNGHYRPSQADVLGRDVLRTSAEGEWQRSWVLYGGIVATSALRTTLDHYSIRQDSTLPAQAARLTPAAGAELRWPWSRPGNAGVVHVIEPVLQVVGSRTTRQGLPDEDSVLVEFDEGNLFSLDRFPGGDRHETGLRVNAGLHYSRLDPTGWQLGLTLGRVWRGSDTDQFAPGSGLGGARSDWLVVTDLTNFALRGSGTISLTNRALFDSDLSFSRNELRLGYDAGRLAMATSYLWLAPDAQQGLPEGASEWVMDAAWRLTANWQARTDWRYDFTADQATRAGLGLTWRNECIAVDLSLSRRFTSSTSVRPTTTFGLSVDLVGFGTGQPGARSRACGL